MQTKRTRNNANIELESLNSQLKQAKSKLQEFYNNKTGLQSRLDENASTQLDQIQAELLEVQYTIHRLEDKVKNTALRAPTSGLIKGLIITAGKVVAPAEEVFSIVPKTENLQAEIEILPKDVGHIKLGDVVYVKVLSYDFSHYGSIIGKPEYFMK